MEHDQQQNWIKWALGAAGLGVVAPFFVLNSGQATVFAIVIIALLVIFVGGYLVWLYLTRKKAKARFGALIGEGIKGAPAGLSAQGIAELSALKNKFQEGIQAYKSRGKDLYSLPWFLLVGESSAGKTEAVRHSGVGFPPGLTDCLQGTGGTINMHWWFTSTAVILDTAGKMMFAGVTPGESTLWQEFLRLLKKARPYCPINGLLLVLPVDSLIKDSANKINEKATLIAKQLDLIQRTLDVRFPVFVLVTKCDLMTGFREFFSGVDDIEATQQIVGWSNPDPLDAAFRPELVDQHLDQVAERLRRRRMAMMRDPAETGPGFSRRTDAVDALFALPQSLLLIAPRLKRYLQTIFVAGEWAPKPVFLRGIYFTSSLQQGSPLDEALAALRGLSPEEMDRDSSDEREEKTFFLYDLFTEKIFKEKGLITRATNTLTMLRRRRWTLLGAGAAALLLWVGVSSYGYFKLKRSIGYEAQLWETAATNWTVAGTWNPIIEQRTNASGPPEHDWRYAGDEKVVGTDLTRAQFPEKLYTLATKSNDVPWIFWPIKTWVRLDFRREEAALALFEHSVVEPVLQAARAKMSSGIVTNQPSPLASLHLAALESLIQLEKDLLAKPQRQNLNPDEARNRIEPLIRYLVETSFSLSNNQVKLLVAYSHSGRGNKTWLPLNFSGGSPLTNNRAIDAGLSQLLNNAMREQAALETNYFSLTNVWESALRFRTAEQGLREAVTNGTNQIENRLKDLNTARTSLDTALSNANSVWTGQFSLQSNYANLTNRAKEASTDAFRLIRGVVSNERDSILGEIYDRVQSNEGRFTKRFKVPDSLLNLGSELDVSFLAKYGSNFHYGFRADLYRNAAKFRDASSNEEGSVADGWEKFFASAKDIIERLKNYQGQQSNELRQTCEVFLRTGVDRFVQNRNTELKDMLGFPVLWDDKKLLRYQDLEQLKQFVEKINDLWSVESLTHYANQATTEPLRENLKIVSNVVNRFCAVKELSVKVDRKRAIQDPKAIAAYRYWAVMFGEDKPQFKDVASGEQGKPPETLAISSLDKPVKIECRPFSPDLQNAGQNTSIIPVEFKGGVIEWLHNASNMERHNDTDKKLQLDNQVWLIPVKVAKGWVYVDVEFGPTTTQMPQTIPRLPSLDRWPRKKDLR